MPLDAGTRLGAYEVVSPLGAGGMGEVHRARDTKIGRDVALKILPESFVHDPERVARFQREAQVLGALNHPHIAAIYGLEESGAQQFLVLELVDGETLDARLKPRAIPVDEALAIARQIADALQAAHDKGIVHRDLKPANIALNRDGQVKVLDFGLAKFSAGEGGATSTGLTHSPTLTFAATQAGMILGTAGGWEPRWRGDSRELFYADRGQQGSGMSVEITGTGSAFSFSAPRRLFDMVALTSAHPGSSAMRYAVTRDGQRFLIPVIPRAATFSDATSPPIAVVVNWAAALGK
jgi:serine/threonine protein kinase